MDDLHTARMMRVVDNMKRDGISQLIVSEPAALKYLTGESIDQGERLTVLILGAAHTWWVKNDLFPLQDDSLPVLTFQDGDDGMQMVADVLEEGPVGIDKTWPSHFLLELMAKKPHLQYVNGSAAVDDARAIKDQEEIRRMREASAVNDRAMTALISWLHEGVTENEAARWLRDFYRKEGCEDVSFPPIIAFGAHGADPHHTTDDTPFSKDLPVLIDIGCKKNGYCSDMTRTYYFSSDEEMETVHNTVRQACEAAEAAVKPGVPLSELDRIARGIIEKAGYGDNFTHRLGHFIGQTDHEAGDVSFHSPIIAKPGMIFSIEPGIYLPNRFGVRIEDLVLVTEEGAEILNRVPHGWKIDN